jgi:hypothetical protein
MPIITGLNFDVDAGTETIWSGGGVWVPPTAARIHAIVSTDADDDGSPAGAGARTVLVTGVKSGVRVSETVTLNGTGSVNTASAYEHITELRVLTVGASGFNEGLITATAATDSTVSAAIGEDLAATTGLNVSSGCFAYAALLGEQLHLRGVTVSANALGAATVSLEVYLVVKPSTGIATRIPLGLIYSGASSVLTVPLDTVLGYGDWARIDVTSSAANVAVAGLLHYTKVA